MWSFIYYRTICFSSNKWCNNESVWVWISFYRKYYFVFIIATIISYPLGLIAGAFPKALLSLDKVSIYTAMALYLILDTFATFWGLRITDYCMQTISAEDISIFVISLIFALLGVSDIKKFRTMKFDKYYFHNFISIRPKQLI